MANKILFKVGDEEKVTFSNFIKSLIEKNNSFETSNLLEKLKEDYDIEVKKQDIKNAVKDSNIYYNSIMDTFYKNYETFMKEV